MTFRVGQKVVCNRNTKWEGGFQDEIDPIYGHIYTIRGIVHYPFGPAGLLLVEIVNAPRSYEEGFYECDFQAPNFRPVVERKTDISVFTAMLTGSKIGADA
jgi:hypothetical protein